MIKKIKFLGTAVYYKIISKNKLAKFLGVNFGKNCNFMTRGWGSEPFLITMGDNVETSSNVVFVTHDGGVGVLRNLYPKYANIDLFAPIVIGNNVFIGINTTILPGTKIEDNVIIGANSLVKGEIKSNSVYAGVPAKFICSIEKYTQKNKEQFDYTRELNPKEKKEYLLQKYNLQENE